jgi:hypothetical protein
MTSNNQKTSQETQNKLNFKNILETRSTIPSKEKDKEHQAKTLLFEWNPLTLKLIFFMIVIGINEDFLFLQLKSRDSLIF